MKKQKETKVVLGVGITAVVQVSSSGKLSEMEYDESEKKEKYVGQFHAFSFVSETIRSFLSTLRGFLETNE